LSLVVASAGLLLLSRKDIRKIRRVWLIITLTFFGFLLGASPNPMEATVRIHKLVKGIQGNPIIPVVLSFIIFTVLSLLGSRLLCSWGCPLGALQESLYNIPILRGSKKRCRFTFSASIAVRITFYMIFFLLLFGILNINQGGPGSILYHHFNLFKIFEPYDLARFTILLIPVFLIACLLVFRPFCHAICPFGLWAWILEKASLYKVRKLNPNACVECKVCEEACPTDAIKALNEGKKKFFKPDCWSCGNCITACPESILKFSRTSKQMTD
jgi:polyferredoxin